MAQTPTFRRPRLRDPRLAVGVLLVAVSVALGAWLFAKADHTIAVYRAGAEVAVGDEVRNAALELINVNLDTATELYLESGAIEEPGALDDSAVFIRPVPAGELVPLSAIGTPADLTLRPMTVTTSVSTAVKVGGVVDMWVTQEDITGSEVTQPELVVAGLHVSGIEEDDSIFAAGRGMVVRVLVPEDDVAKVLAALRPRATITLIPRLGG